MLSDFRWFKYYEIRQVLLRSGWGGGGGGDYIPSLLGCVCSKVMDMGPFWAPSA